MDPLAFLFPFSPTTETSLALTRFSDFASSMTPLMPWRGLPTGPWLASRHVQTWNGWVIVGAPPLKNTRWKPIDAHYPISSPADQLMMYFIRFLRGIGHQLMTAVANWTTHPGFGFLLPSPSLSLPLIPVLWDEFPNKSCTQTCISVSSLRETLAKQTLLRQQVQGDWRVTKKRLWKIHVSVCVRERKTES